MDDEESKIEGHQARIPTPGRWSDVMDELIQEAMRSGAFDDLPGKGKPLKLLNNPYAPETELAYQLLKDNDYTLPWIAERGEVMEKVAALRSAIGRTWSRHQAEYGVARDETIRLALALSWSRRLEGWQEEIKALNKEIAGVNLKLPAGVFEILKLDLNPELERAGAGETLE